jgi:hypothetical protein
MMKVGFGYFSRGRSYSAWQSLQDNRAKRAAVLQQAQANIQAVGSSISNAMLNHISGGANNAANAAISRIQAEGKAKSAAALKQVDAAQTLINQTKTSFSTSATGVNTTA